MSYTIPGEPMYSIADSLRDEGIEIGFRKGRNEGRVEEIRRVLLRQLEKRFDLTDKDRGLVTACTDIDNLEAAAELLIEPDATIDAVLELLQAR